ncbi:MAG: hypothetical protein ACYTHK_02770 [Planctomycetota bacterium]
MRNVATPLLGVLLLAAAGWVGWKIVLPRLSKPVPGTRAPVPGIEPAGLPAEFVSRIETTGDLEAADLLRTAKSRFTLPKQRAEFARLRESRREKALSNLEREIAALLEESRCRDAVRRIGEYERGWGETGLLTRVRSEQKRLITERLAEVDALVEDGRYVAAREACKPPAGLFEEEAEQAFADHAKQIEKRIRKRSYRPTEHTPVIESGPVPQPTQARPPAPPPLPGPPHPDVKRMGEARKLLMRMAKLFRAGQHGPLVKAADDLIGYFGDLQYVQRRHESLQAIRSFARYKSGGVKGLFHAAEVAMLGSALQLTYRFASSDELLDWEEMKPIPHAQGGRFEQARNGVRGTGVAALVMRAFFESNVKMSCVSKPQKPQSHGIAFFEAGNETRQVMLLATNHWFTEGENYVKKRPGHSVLLIGKGVNNDVPVDSPEIGFVFKGPSRARPSPPGGAEIDLSISLNGDQLKAQVGYKGDSAKLGVQARGDDGRGFQRHRPALYVIEAGVIFREVKVRGKLHPDFVREREGELLDLAESAFDGVE